MTNTNILEKYNIIKQAALDSKMVQDVTLALSEEHVADLILDAKSRHIYLVPVDCALHTDEDYVKFDIIVVDKVNNDDDEEYILQSWSNGIALLRQITGKLNYKESESVVLETVTIGVSAFSEEDGERQNVVTMLTSSLDMEFNLATRVNYD